MSDWPPPDPPDEAFLAMGRAKLRAIARVLLLVALVAVAAWAWMSL